MSGTRDVSVLDLTDSRGPEATQSAVRLDTDRPSQVARLVRSGWIPAGLVVAFTGGALRLHEVPVATVATFGAYVAAGVVLPGSLLWRYAHRGERPLVEDVAAGAALGFAIETLVYIAARGVGAPLLIVAFPLVTIGAFLVVPQLRRYWRPRCRAAQPPVWWAWGVAAAYGLLVAWSCATRWHGWGLDTQMYRRVNVDTTMNLAFLGELKHHMPPMVPYVQGEPMSYHWFAFAEMAASSWATGIEPQLLLQRLAPLPWLGAFTVLVALTAHRLTGRWWPGLVAVASTYLGLAPYPYAWPFTNTYGGGTNMTDDGSLLRPFLWGSPTMTFGTMLLVPAVMIVLDGLGRRLSPRQWCVLAVLVIAIMGAKVSLLPVLLSGLLCTCAVALVIRRAIPRVAVLTAGLVAACLTFALFVLYGGASLGLRFEPLATMTWTSARLADLAGVSGFVGHTDYGFPGPRRTVAVVSVATVLCWACVWFGVAGLVRTRRALRPEWVLLLGMGAAGMAAVLLLGHPALGQTYFLQSARPYLAIAAVCGFASLLAGTRLGRSGAVGVTAAVAVGTATMMFIRAVGDQQPPRVGPTLSAAGLGLDLGLPYLLMLIAIGVAAFVFGAARRWRGLQSDLALALLIAFVAGLGAPAAWDQVRYAVKQGSSTRADLLAAPAMISSGAREAGRFLRDHSQPGDLVATNAHCRTGSLENPRKCSNLHFWISGFTERRILVEGWGYTAHAFAQARPPAVTHNLTPYWKPAVLADNEAAFRHPSAGSIARLRDYYGVRWMFVIESPYYPHAANIDNFATLRYRAGECAVYELPGAGAVPAPAIHPQP